MLSHPSRRKKKGGNALGQSIINAKKKNKSKFVSNHHLAEPVEEDEQNSKRLKSVLEMKSMDEFLSLASLSNKTFEAEKIQNVVMINENQVIDPKEQEKKFLDAFYSSSASKTTHLSLRIPRKPKWDKKMKKEQIKQQENDVFIAWRKSIAETEEKNMKLSITPFEKNIDIWRQLWQVIEKSQVVLQLVDGRNPLFYRCTDLENYVSEVNRNKQCILLVNKADYLSNELIEHWKKYFEENNVKAMFFSAKREQQLLDGEKVEECSPNIISRKDLLKELKKIVEERFKEEKTNSKESSEKPEQKETNNKIMIGLVGYPNVGKSSVINVLCGKKRVSVSSQPGKTKHFQTIPIDEENVVLCDCPGLVFPSFTNSKAEMMCGGVISIDHSADFDTPMILVVQRIPRKILEEVYNIKLPEASIYMSPQNFLHILARERGYVTGSALPDFKKTAKMVLKDYVNGKLLYCHLRPDYDPAKHGVVINTGIGVPMPEIAAPIEKNEKSEEPKIEKPEIKENIEKKEEKKMVIFSTKTKEEEKMDKEFFTSEKPAIQQKLTKDQKRQLKFAERRGEDISKLSMEEIRKRSEKKPKRTPKPVQPQIKPGYRTEGNFFDLLEI